MAILNDLLVNGISRFIGGVIMSATNVTSSTTYYPVLATGTSTSLFVDTDKSGLSFTKVNGTTGAEGTATLTLGNTTASGTAGNATGQLKLLDYYGYAATIRPGESHSSAVVFYLPNWTGSVERLVSMPTPSTQVGGTSTPVYVDSKGHITVCTSVMSHTHNLGITTGTSSDTSQITLSHGTKYVLSAGGSTYCFTMPSGGGTGTVTGSGIASYLAKWSGTSGASTDLTVGPLIGTGTTKFLREDGTWQVPSGGGGSSDGPFYVAGTNSIACVTTSPYYSSRWKGTNSQITSLYTGLTINFKIDVAGNGSYGTVLNINNLGEHPVCANVNTYISTRYAVNCIITLIYDANQTATAYINSSSASTITGVWKIADYDNTNTYYFMQAYTQLVVNTNAGNVYRNQILLSKPDLSVIPVNNVNNGPGTYNKTLTSQSFDPFGPIYYFNYTGTGSYTPGNVTPSWYAYRVILGDIRYSFNINSGGTAGTTALTASRPVYIKALYNDSTKQATLAPITSSTNYLELSSLTQSLPSTNPNSSLSAGQRYIYIYLGHAYDKYRVDFAMQHQVYTWNPASGAMQEFTGAPFSGSGTFSMTHTVSSTTTTDTWNYYKQGKNVTVWGTFTGTPGASLDSAGGLPFKSAFSTKQTVCIHNVASELIYYCAVGLTANSSTFSCFGFSGSTTDEWGTWLGILKNSNQTITFSYITDE